MPDWVREKPCSDCSGWYFPVAENLADGSGLVVGDQKRPALDRPPGQVLLLSALFRVVPSDLVNREMTVYAYNIFLLAISAVLLFNISRSFWGIKGGKITAAFWTTSPFVLWFLNQPYSEVPFFVALYFGVWVILRAGCAPNLLCQLILVGVSLGIATLIRPIGFALLVPFLIVFWIMARDQMWKIRVIGFALILFGYVAILAPWHVYLYDQKDALVFLSDGTHGHRSVVEGFIFGIKSEEYKEGLDLHPKVKKFMHDMYESVYLHNNDVGMFTKYGPSGLYDVRSAAAIIQIAWERFAADPSLGWRFFWLKVTRSWYGTDSHRNEDVSMICMSVYLLVAGLGLWMTVRDRRTRALGVFTVLLTLYFWSFAIVFTPLVRYMIPALGMLFLVVPGIWRAYDPEE